MRKLFLILAAGFMLTTVTACSDHGHSHDDESNPHDDAPQHHDSIDKIPEENL